MFFSLIILILEVSMEGVFSQCSLKPYQLKIYAVVWLIYKRIFYISQYKIDLLYYSTRLLYMFPCLHNNHPRFSQDTYKYFFFQNHLLYNTKILFFKCSYLSITSNSFGVSLRIVLWWVTKLPSLATIFLLFITPFCFSITLYWSF